ncbi:UNVERIFIED_CONTAM: hypothetical protein FKN15_075188 [Acipenser sinensis]
MSADLLLLAVSAARGATGGRSLSAARIALAEGVNLGVISMSADSLTIGSISAASDAAGGRIAQAGGASPGAVTVSTFADSITTSMSAASGTVAGSAVAGVPQRRGNLVSGTPEEGAAGNREGGEIRRPPPQAAGRMHSLPLVEEPAGAWSISMAATHGLIAARSWAKTVTGTLGPKGEVAIEAMCAAHKGGGGDLPLPRRVGGTGPGEEGGEKEQGVKRERKAAAAKTATTATSGGGWGWEAFLMSLAAELCSGCGAYGHTLAICPTQYEEGELAPKWEEPELPAPRRGEPELPAPRRGEPVPPAPRRGRSAGDASASTTRVRLPAAPILLLLAVSAARGATGGRSLSAARIALAEGVNLGVISMSADSLTISSISAASDAAGGRIAQAGGASPGAVTVSTFADSITTSMSAASGTVAGSAVAGVPQRRGTGYEERGGGNLVSGTPEEGAAGNREGGEIRRPPPQAAGRMHSLPLVEEPAGAWSISMAATHGLIAARSWAKTVTGTLGPKGEVAIEAMCAAHKGGGIGA